MDNMEHFFVQLHTVCWFVRLKRRSRLSLVGIGHHRICAKLLAKVYRKHFPIEATADGGACLFGLTACRLSAMQIVVCHERKSTPFLPTHWEKGFFEVILVKSYTQSQIYTWGSVHKLCCLKGGGGQKLPILPRKTTTNRGRDQKLPILRRHSLWTAPCIFWLFISKIEKLEKISCQIVVA